jgi:hypothetical protein
MLQIRIPDKGRTENGWINVERDLGHVFRDLVKEAVTSIPEDDIVPKPSDEEIQKFVKSLVSLLTRSEDGKITAEEVDAEILSWDPGLASAFQHFFARMMFQKYRLWRQDLMPMRRVETPAEEKK